MAKQTPKTRTCTKCGKTKRIAEFSPKTRYTDGLNTQCKRCSNQAQRALYAKIDPERIAADNRKSYLKSRYGLTVEEYDAMLSASEGGCWICGYMPKPGGRRLAVDHDHKKPKRIRGLLCHMCNRGIAHFRDSPDRLNSAAHYLEGPLGLK